MRWIFRLIMLVAVVVLVAVGSLFLLPGDRIAKIAADQISSFTGRKVTMAGETKVSFYPILGVSTGAVTIANAGWSDAGPMFQAESLKIGVKPVALFGGDIRITGFEAVNPRINLERAADGRVNWELGVDGVAPSGQQAGDAGAPAEAKRLALSLDRALIKNASLAFTDHGTGQRTEIAGLDADLRWPRYDGKATFDVTLHRDEAPVKISGHLNRVSDFIDGEVTALRAEVKAKGGAVNFDGRISTAPQAQGRLSVDVEKTRPFLKALGLADVTLPNGVAKSVSLRTSLTLSDATTLALRDTVLTLDGQTVTGVADLDIGGKRPKLAAKVKAGALDLSALGGPGGTAENAKDKTAKANTGTEAGKPARDWMRQPVDTAPLGWMDAELALVAESIELGDVKLGKTRVRAALENKRLALDMRELQVFGGQIKGQLEVDAREGLRLAGDIDARDINLKPVARLAGQPGLSGTAGGRYKFRGGGGTPQAILDSLGGDLRARVANQGGTLAFAGTAGAAPQAEGKLSADIGDTAAFMQALGLDPVDIPKGLGRSVALETELSLTRKQTLSLKYISARLDGNAFKGDARLALGGGKPKITANLAAGALDFRSLTGAGGGAATESAAASGWSTEKIDASALALADADVTLAAASIDLGDYKLGRTKARITLDRSRLVAALQELRIYDGLITGQFVANNRSGLSVGGDITAAGISMERMLSEMAGVTRLSGKAEAKIKFLGAGQSQHAIMNSLSGEGSLKMGRGVISGIDLDKLMRSGQVTGGTTIFDEMGATFKIKDGVLRNRDLRMKLPLIQAKGRGAVGLGKRNIDYLFTPMLLKNKDRKGLAIPVRIRGPWASPSILPDLAKAVDMNFKEEKEKLKEKANRKVKRAVEKELGVTVGEGENLGDALQNSLEGEVTRGLQKLFE